MTPKQKTITLRVAVPDWAKYVATDYDGQTWVFPRKPTHDDRRWWHSGKRGYGFQVGISTKPRNWRKTLRRIR